MTANTATEVVARAMLVIAEALAGRGITVVGAENEPMAQAARSKRMKIGVFAMRRVVGVISCIVGLLLSSPGVALAQGGGVETQTTASDKIVLVIGPVEQMLMPDQARGATSGEVMVAMPGMPMPTMTMTDQGHAVNHHLEVHVFKTTGAVVKDLMPTITITDAMGNARTLSSIMAMYGVKEGQSDWHFGNHVDLPAGSYTVAVKVGNEEAVFKDVMVGAAGAAPMAMPQTTPKSGGTPVALVLAFGAMLAGIGDALRCWALARSSDP